MNIGKTYCKTDRIELRSLEISDVDLLYRWENQYEDLIFNESYNPISKECIKNFIINSNNYLSYNSSITMIIDEKKLKKSVGYIQLLEYNPMNRRGEIGIFIDKDFRKKNIAKDTIGIFLRYAFNRWNLRMVYAKVLDNNIPSNNLFNSVGFQLVSSIPEWSWSNDRFISLNYYQLCNL